MVFDVKPIVSTVPYDCGAVCLKMLLDYYGKDVDLETLYKDCNITVGGCTGADIMRAGRKYGLDMKAWAEKGCKITPSVDAKTIDVDTLKEDRPAIIWWKYNHFCILCGVDDETGKVVICNPNRGRYSVSKSLFNAFYTKVSITNGEPKELSE